jgi:hypothetical protein
MLKVENMSLNGNTMGGHEKVAYKLAAGYLGDKIGLLMDCRRVCKSFKEIFEGVIAERVNPLDFHIMLRYGLEEGASFLPCLVKGRDFKLLDSPKVTFGSAFCEIIQRVVYGSYFWRNMVQTVNEIKNCDEAFQNKAFSSIISLVFASDNLSLWNQLYPLLKEQNILFSKDLLSQVQLPKTLSSLGKH